MFRQINEYCIWRIRSNQKIQTIKIDAKTDIEIKKKLQQFRHNRINLKLVKQFLVIYKSKKEKKDLD